MLFHGFINSFPKKMTFELFALDLFDFHSLSEFIFILRTNVANSRPILKNGYYLVKW